MHYIIIISTSFGIQEAHLESNKRVLAIVDALEKLELSPKVYRQYYFEYSQLFFWNLILKNTFFIELNAPAVLELVGVCHIGP